MFSKLKIKLKQLFCKHKNLLTKWEYKNCWAYNEFFDDAQSQRNKYHVCKDCGKVFKPFLAEPIFSKSIYEECKNEYLKIESKEGEKN